MKTGGTKVRVRPSRAARVRQARELLQPLLELLTHEGHEPRDLAAQVAAICASFAKPKRNWRGERSGYLLALAESVARWHAQRRYTDHRGEPHAIPLKGPGSLQEILQGVWPQADVSAAARLLVRIGVLRRSGSRYVPTGRDVLYGGDPASARAYGLRDLRAVLKVVQRNTLGNPRAPKLFQRSAHAVRLPVSALPALYRDFEVDGREFLWRWDRRMNRFASSKRNEPTTHISVVLVMTEDPAASNKFLKARTPAAAKSSGRVHSLSRSAEV